MLLRDEDIDRWLEHGVMIPTRHILLSDGEDDEITSKTADRFICAMHLLEQTEDDIYITLRTKGGCVFAGLAIYDTIAQSPCHVTIDVVGCAMSMGAQILQAADYRRMHPNAILMCHDGTQSVEDNVRTVESWTEATKNMRQQMYDIFAKRSGKSRKFWEQKCATDYILTAKEALKVGLIDEIIAPASASAAVSDPS